MRHTWKAFKINTVVFLKQDPGSQESGGRDPELDSCCRQERSGATVGEESEMRRPLA